MRTSDEPRQAFVIERGIRVALVVAVAIALVPVGAASGLAHVLLLATAGIAVAFVTLRTVAHQRRPRLDADGSRRFFALRYRGAFQYTSGELVLGGAGMDYRLTRGAADDALSIPWECVTSATLFGQSWLSQSFRVILQVGCDQVPSEVALAIWGTPKEFLSRVHERAQHLE